MKSMRTDGRGHWQKGVARIEESPEARQAVAKIKRLYRRDGASYADIAKAIGSDRKSVWRWAKGVRLPTREMAKKILATTDWLPPTI